MPKAADIDKDPARPLLFDIVGEERKVGPKIPVGHPARGAFSVDRDDA
jgi:hypothetical protein